MSEDEVFSPPLLLQNFSTPKCVLNVLSGPPRAGTEGGGGLHGWVGGWILPYPVAYHTVESVQRLRISDAPQNLQKISHQNHEGYLLDSIFFCSGAWFWGDGIQRLRSRTVGGLGTKGFSLRIEMKYTSLLKNNPSMILFSTWIMNYEMAGIFSWVKRQRPCESSQNSTKWGMEGPECAQRLGNGVTAKNNASTKNRNIPQTDSTLVRIISHAVETFLFIGPWLFLNEEGPKKFCWQRKISLAEPNPHRPPVKYLIGHNMWN